MLNMILIRNSMYQVITLQGGSQHLNLCRAEGFRHQICLFLALLMIVSKSFSDWGGELRLSPNITNQKINNGTAIYVLTPLHSQIVSL